MHAVLHFGVVAAVVVVVDVLVVVLVPVLTFQVLGARKKDEGRGLALLPVMCILDLVAPPRVQAAK